MTMFVGHPNISNQSWHAYEYKHMNTQETILQLEDLKLTGMAFLSVWNFLTNLLALLHEI